MAFFEIAVASHSCYLFLTLLTLINLDKNIQTDVIYLNLAKTFNFVDCFKSSNDMMWKAARSPGFQITKVEDLKGSFWMMLLRNGPQLHQELFRAAYSTQLYLSFLLMTCPWSVLPEGTQSAPYAYDTKVYSSISSTADCERLQQALTNLSWVIIITHDSMPLNAKF